MNELVEFLRSHDHYLIISHARPDGDTIGSAAGLCVILRAMGKTAFTAPNDEITAKYLPYAKPYFAPVTYEHKTVLTVDTATRDLLPKSRRDAVVEYRIDHHPTVDHYARHSYSDPQCGACGELIYRLSLALPVSLTAEMALPLYLAITTDTGCFRYANTTADTHRAAAALIDTGFDRYGLDDSIFSSRRRARIAIEAAVFRSLRFYADGQIAAIQIPRSLLSETGATEDDLENISALPRDIDGVRIGLTFREETEGCKLSVRSAAPYAANKICAAFGGGGHDRAAGCTLSVGLEDAEAALLSAIGKQYPELEI